MPSTLNFSVGCFEGRQSTKKWLVSTEDLHAMYFAFQQSGKADIFLWYDGVCDEGEVTATGQMMTVHLLNVLKKRVKLMTLLLISRTYMVINTLSLNIDYGLE